ncbi:MAG: hypothetical protein M5U19_17895 [Microthrixaceae bacterium]|nr:hypothetical protein [Microthrixaceae bacterium]
MSGEVYSVGMGRVARVFVGVAAGWTAGDSISAEDVRDNFDQIRSEDGYVVPSDIMGEMVFLSGPDAG